MGSVKEGEESEERMYECRKRWRVDGVRVCGRVGKGTKPFHVAFDVEKVFYFLS